MTASGSRIAEIAERHYERCGYIGPGDTCSYDRGHNSTHSWDFSPADPAPAAGAHELAALEEQP